MVSAYNNLHSRALNVFFFFCFFSYSVIHFVSLCPKSRVNIVRSVSLCLWALPRGVALAIHVGNFARETALCVYPGMNLRRHRKLYNYILLTLTA